MEMKFEPVGSKPWVLKDDHIIIGKGFFTRTIYLSELKTSYGFYYETNSLPDAPGKFCNHLVFNVNGNRVMLSYMDSQLTEAIAAIHYIIDHSAMTEKDKETARNSSSRPLPNKDSYDPYKAAAEASKNKDASVVGRAVAGGIIAGPAGAIVGALSAVDKNNKKNK